MTNEELYELFRLHGGDFESMLSVPGVPDKGVLKSLAHNLKWYDHLDRDGVLVDLDRVDELKAREARRVAEHIRRIDQKLATSRSKDDKSSPEIKVTSTEFSRLIRMRIELGKYYQLLLGEPTSRDAVVDEGRRKALRDKFAEDELRELRSAARKELNSREVYN